MKDGEPQAIGGMRPASENWEDKAPPPPPSSISPLRFPPSTFRSRLAFTILEVLVAVAVLAVMMTFLFDLLGSSAKLWEIGNRKIEAAQTARVGLNIMANDLQNAFAGNMTSFTSTGTRVNNIAPFLAVNNPLDSDVIDLGGGALNASGSQQLFGVLSSGDTSQPFKEFGYLCVFLNSADGTDPMIGYRYYLVRKLANGTAANGNFFLRSADNSWAGDSTDFSPVIDNCVRMTLEYFGNEAAPNGTPDWTADGSWTPTDRLPLGVLVTVTVLDSKSAMKVATVKGNAPLTEGEIDSIFDPSPPDDGLETILRQGSVTMSRFIPLNRN